MAGTGSITAQANGIDWTLLAEQAAEAGVFGTIECKGGRLECAAANSAQPATYRLEFDGPALYVVLVMADRWQSHSIEADLLNTGDKAEELISEELGEVGYSECTKGDSLVPCEHFRSEDKLFTFRSKVPAEATVIAFQWLLAYEAAFRRLGDMDAGPAGE
ncbi:MAG: hypothetical protein NTV94_15485 [Planctomycetota bacterium]|nr:hypothetical protein [Planctomycetota bacterium]